MDPLHVYALFEVLNGRTDPNSEIPRSSRRHRVGADPTDRRRGRIWRARSRPRDTRPPRRNRLIGTRPRHAAAPDLGRDEDAFIRSSAESDARDEYYGAV